MPLANGAVFAGYTILRVLGTGGMGEVYLAQHPRLPRKDAIKVLPAELSADTDFRARFNREADLAAKLFHPHIVGLHDRGEFDGQLWISMDFIDGTDVARLLRDRYPVGMPPDEVAAIIAAIASALDCAHRNDLLHRDVKPANILLTKPGDADERILLGDFGIARSTGEISGLTATNMTIGTLAYAAPEQLTDQPMDGRADQYSLAATAYHLLTGSTLFPHTNPAVVISRHLNTPPPALADTYPHLAALDPVLAVALKKNPADRFASCTDFAEAFAEAAGSGGHPKASDPTMHASAPPRPPERSPDTPQKSTKVRCNKCQHVQTVPLSQETFLCAQCGTKLKRRNQAGRDNGDGKRTGPVGLPGWYSDPSGKPGYRYFDGYDWSDDHRTGPSAPSPSPGWYRDPSGAGAQRYFDGIDWTSHTAPLGPIPNDQRADLLNIAVAREVAMGARVESHTTYQAVVVYGSNPPHIVFALLSIFTCGLFLIVWLIVAATQHERRVSLLVDPYGNITRS
jgi:serine/threonine protein kinase